MMNKLRHCRVAVYKSWEYIKADATGTITFETLVVKLFCAAKLKRVVNVCEWHVI